MWLWCCSQPGWKIEDQAWLCFTCGHLGAHGLLLRCHLSFDRQCRWVRLGVQGQMPSPSPGGQGKPSHRLDHIVHPPPSHSLTIGNVSWGETEALRSSPSLLCLLEAHPAQFPRRTRNPSHPARGSWTSPCDLCSFFPFPERIRAEPVFPKEAVIGGGTSEHSSWSPCYLTLMTVMIAGPH